MDSIWKSKVSSDDNFLLDFNLPWRFTIFIQPREKLKSLKSIKRGMLPKKMQMETYNPSTRGWCLFPAGSHEWRLSVGYLQHKYSQIKLENYKIYNVFFLKERIADGCILNGGHFLQGMHSSCTGPLCSEGNVDNGHSRAGSCQF